MFKCDDTTNYMCIIKTCDSNPVDYFTRIKTDIPFKEPCEICKYEFS